MSKSSKPKKQEPNIKAKIDIDGDVSNSNIMIGHGNTIINEVVKTEYSLFTIPLPVTDFTGREKELAQLKASFKNGAVITGMSGGGGVGKTELARKLAQEIADDYPNARMSIDLLGTSENPLAPEEVMRRILEPFHPNQKIPNEPEQLKGLYQQTFSAQKTLLLLDNAANAAQVRPLIPPAPSAAIFTSRQYFSLTEFGLQEPLPLNVFSPKESQSFLRNASNKLNHSTDNDIEQLSSLCGYLPLALRIAISILNDRLDYTLKILVNSLSDEHTRLERLKRENDADLDMEATISLSYNLLPAKIKQHFYSISIFKGFFWKNSVAAILDIGSEDEANSILGVLLNRNLIGTFSGPFSLIGESKIIQMNYYFFHDLTKLFASKLLNERVNEARIIIERHAYYYLGLVIALLNDSTQNNVGIFHVVWPELFTAWQRMQSDYIIQPNSDPAKKWNSDFVIIYTHMINSGIPIYQRIEIENKLLKKEKNVRDEFSDDSNLSKDMPEENGLDGFKHHYAPKEIVHLINLGDSYNSAGEPLNAIPILMNALELTQSTSHITEFVSKLLTAKIYGNIGNAYYALMENTKALEYYQSQLDISREINDKEGEATALGNIGNYHNQIGKIQDSLSFYEKQLSLSKQFGLKHLEGNALGNMAVAFNKLDMRDQALNYHEKAIIIAQEIGDKRMEGSQLIGIGLYFDGVSDFQKAVETFEQALSVLREIGDQKSESVALVNLGSVYYQYEKKEKARQYWTAALEIFLKTGDPNWAELKNKIDRLDVKLLAENFKQVDSQELIRSVLEAVSSKKPKAEYLFNAVTELLRYDDVVSEKRELLIVLQKILVGIKAPDLSGLSEPDRNLIRSSLPY